MLDIISKTSGGNLADRTVQTYAALLERKLIVPSASQPYLAIDQHFFFDHFAQTLSHIYIDEDWYLTKYRDIPEAIENGTVASARHHYIRFGFYEHRLPYKIAVDEAWYLETYPDVKTAVEKRHFASGQAHFEADGFCEGRLPYPNFALRNGEDLPLQQTSKFFSPVPVMAVRSQPSVFRASSHDGHDTMVGLSLSPWTSMSEGTDDSSHPAGLCFAWLARAAAMIILMFGMATDVSHPSVAFGMMVTVAPADAATTVPNLVDASTNTDKPKSDASAEEVPRDSNSAVTVSRITARAPGEEPRGEARAEGITTPVQPVSMIRRTAMSEPPSPELSALPTPDFAQRPAVRVPYDKAIRAVSKPSATNQLLPPTSSKEEQRNALGATASPHPEATQTAESSAATSSESLTAAAILPPDVAKLLELGAVRFAVGDISAARELYKRAAAAGSSQAAVEIGRTYDPRFLAVTGAVGIRADTVVATNWYRLAMGLGNAEAARLLRQ